MISSTSILDSERISALSLPMCVKCTDRLGIFKISTIQTYIVACFTGGRVEGVSVKLSYLRSELCRLLGRKSAQRYSEPRL